MNRPRPRPRFLCLGTKVGRKEGCCCCDPELDAAECRIKVWVARLQDNIR